MAPAADPKQRNLLAAYAVAPAEYAWRLKPRTQAYGYTVYDLTYPSPIKTEHAQNNTVWGEYFRAPGDQPRPAVIVLHILDGKFLESRLVCHTLVTAGMDAVLIKLPYYGERKPPEVNRKDLQRDPTAYRQTVVQAVGDVRRAAELLATVPHVDPKRIGLVGTSLGGFTAALTAGVDGGFPRVAIVLAGGDLAAVLEHNNQRERDRYRAQLEKLGPTPEARAAALVPVDPLTFASRLRPANVLMLNCADDEIVPAACARKLAEAAKPREHVWYPGKHTDLLKHVLDAMARVRQHFAPVTW